MGYVRNKIRALKACRNPDELIPPRTRIEVTLPDGRVFEGVAVSHAYDDDASVRNLGMLVELSEKDLIKWSYKLPQLGSDLLKPWQIRKITEKAKRNPSREDQIKNWHAFRNKISTTFNGRRLQPELHGLDSLKREVVFKFPSADYEAIRDVMDIDARGYPLDEYEIIGGKDPNILYFAPKV